MSGQPRQEYPTFLETKRLRHTDAGREVPLAEMHPALFPFQRDAVQWALRKGRAALWHAVGLGKTIEEVEWAHHIQGRVLIVAPLAVAHQTVRMAQERLGYAVTYVRHPSKMEETGIFITNYEMIHEFIATHVDGLILDESSMLAHLSGARRKLILTSFQDVPYRLSCTATPCRNAIEDLGSQAEFLGVMTLNEMRSTFFVHDQDGWRLRGHAARPFFRWLASWAQAMNSPADLGYDASAYQLPPLTIREHIVETGWRRSGELFPGQLKGIADRADIRRQSAQDRVQRVAELANETDEQVLIWCGLNDEGTACLKAIPDAVEVAGSHPFETKLERLMGFIEGRYRVLITKGKIAGHGLNLQQCHRMMFMGLNDSWELFHQSIGRCYRYGQEKPVTVDVVLTDHETGILTNVKRKAAEAQELVHGMIQAAKEYMQMEVGMRDRPQEDFQATQDMRIPAWLM